VGGKILAGSGGWGADVVAFSHDGKLLASVGGDSKVRLWNPATGRPTGAPLRIGRGLVGIPGGVAFSPDGKLLAIARADADGTVRLWNPATRPPARALHHTSAGDGPDV